MQGPARRNNEKRDTHREEAIALTVAALGAVSRWAGVQWINTKDKFGNPIAVALITGAQFNEQDGKTTLTTMEKK